jgi:multidrug efflux system membrane fusion protein
MTNWLLNGSAMNIQLGLFALALALLQGCAPSVPQQEPMRSVKLITVQAPQASSSTGWSAEVRARHEARLSFRTGGQLIQRPLGLGTRFKAGQVLAELDPQDQGLGVQAAQAQRLAAQAQYDLALSDFKRYETLFAQGFIGSAEMDRRRTAWQAAQAQLDQARVQADLQLNQARYTRLIPDRAGIVIGIEAEPGQVLTAGAPVLRVAWEGPREVQIWVSEDQIQHWATGQTVQVSRWGETRRLSARVREVGASADPQTRSFLVRIDLPANADWALGQTARVWQDKAPSASSELIVPTSALVQLQGQPHVWVYQPAQRQVQPVAVEVLRYQGDQVVLGAGLTAGQQVVALGGHVLTPGQVVTPFVGKNPSPQPADSHAGGRP